MQGVRGRKAPCFFNMTQTAAWLAGPAIALAMTQSAFAIDADRLAGLIEADMALFGLVSQAPLEIAIKGGDAFIAPFQANEGDEAEWINHYNCRYWSCFALPDGMVLEAITHGEDGFAANALVVPRLQWDSFGVYFDAQAIRLEPVRLGEPRGQYNGLLTSSSFVDFARYQLGEINATGLERESSAMVGPSQMGAEDALFLSFDGVVQRTLIDPDANLLYDSISIAGIESSEDFLDIWSDIPLAADLMANLSNLTLEQDWTGDGQLTLAVQADLGTIGSIRLEADSVLIAPQVYLDLIDMRATEAELTRALGEVSIQSAVLTLDLAAPAELFASDDQAMVERWLSLAIDTEQSDAALMDFFETGASLAIVFDTGRPMSVAKLIEIAMDAPFGHADQGLMRFMRLESAGS